METTAASQTTETTAPPATLIVSQGASAKVNELLEREGNPDYFLRVAVQPGGCSGLRYALYFDDRKLDGDVVTDIGAVQVRLDRMSAPYLKGAKLDWKDSLQESGFVIDNPNASGSCACGDSFH